MLFMIVWWILVISLVLLVLIRKSIIKNRKQLVSIDNLIGFLALMQLIIIIITVALRDPIFQSIGLPQEYEWIGGLLAGGFISWNFYLNPLKNRVIEVEKDTSSIKTSINHIEGDIGWIKDNCISVKKNK